MLEEITPFEAVGGPITLAFSEDGRVFFSERVTGCLWEILKNSQRLVKRFDVVPITGHHEAGLIGIVIDPEFKKNNNVYCFYTYGTAGDELKNKIVRVDAKTGDQTVVFDGIPGGIIHNGGIILIGPDKKLYVGVGVQNEIKEKSQEVDHLGGKVLRLNLDGTIPGDNPFSGSAVFSLGHRNIFGMAFHPESKELYICEEGPDENDEINIIKPGGNYGWPLYTGVLKKTEFVDPILTFTPTITPTQCLFFKDEFYFGSYNEGSVHCLTLDGTGRRIMKDRVVYCGRPFGVVGVFKDNADNFFVTTPNKIIQFTPDEG